VSDASSVQVLVAAITRVGVGVGGFAVVCGRQAKMLMCWFFDARLAWIRRGSWADYMLYLAVRSRTPSNFQTRLVRWRHIHFIVVGQKFRKPVRNWMVPKSWGQSFLLCRWHRMSSVSGSESS